jgi:hypothetical protein
LGFDGISDLVRQVRLAARGLAKQPGLALAAVLTLALGIGGSTAIFSLVDSILLTPPPFRQPGSLVVIWSSNPTLAHTSGMEDKLPVAAGDFFDWQRELRSVERMAILQPDRMALTGQGDPQQLGVVRVSGDFAAVLGTTAALGRTLGPADEVPGKPAAVVLSDAAWRRWFGGDPRVIGRKVLLDAYPLTVVGVMPARFAFPRGGEMPAAYGFAATPDAWVPIALTADERAARSERVNVAIARLRPGVGAAAAAAELRASCERLGNVYAADKGWSARVMPLTEQMVGDVRPALLMLAGAVGCVLLIACANVANLLLARAASRQREIAVRSALGASRGRLVTQLLIESGLLSLVGGIAGVLLAVVALRLAAAVVPPSLAGLAGVSGAAGAGAAGAAVTASATAAASATGAAAGTVAAASATGAAAGAAGAGATGASSWAGGFALDGWVLAFSGALCILTSLLAGLVPVLQTARPQLAQLLRGGIRAGAGTAGSRRTRNALVAAEMALAVVLLIGAGLLMRSFVRLLGVDPGFKPAHVLTFETDLPADRQPLERSHYFDRVVERLLALPGVQAAGGVSELPMAGTESKAGVYIEGRPVPTQADQVMIASSQKVTPGYFATLGIRLLRGRLLEPGDTAGKPLVAVIDDTMARDYWPNEDPIGKRFRRAKRGARGAGGADDPGNPWYTVVGIVGTVHQGGLPADPHPQMYRTAAQTLPALMPYQMVFALRTAGDPATLAAAARAAVREVDPNQPVSNLKTLQQVVGESIAPRRFQMILLAVFAALALVLSAVGIYGVTSYSVAQRTRELGLRMALGSQPAGVLRLVLKEAATLAALGLLAGLLAAFVLRQAIASLLFGVGPLDPPTFLAVSLTLLLIALAAAWLPGRRATRVDPIEALRAE